MSAVSVVQVGVQAEPCDLVSWTALARRLESDGFAALLMGDHPGSGASPWTALGAAAAVTDTLGVGTYVLNTGVRDPVRIAAEAATLNLLAPGRVHLGLGAGHTPAEWTQIGLTRPDAAARVQRLAETLEVVAPLLAGEVVTHHGEHLHLHEARLQDLPTTAAGAAPVHLIVGGGNRALLALAARHADVVALSGLGRTLPDGHRHEVRWAEQDLRTQLAVIDNGVRGAGRRLQPAPALEALVQAVTVTEDREATAAQWASRVAGANTEQVLSTPFMLIGTHEQMAEQLVDQAKQWGITRYVVREAAVDDLAIVLEILRRRPA